MRSRIRKTIMHLISIVMIVCMIFDSGCVTLAKEKRNVHPVEYTARQITDNIKIGLNLGNSLDSCISSGRSPLKQNTSYYETAWGNPVISKELIDQVHAAGFNAIRIPVTWYYNTYTTSATKCQIQECWLNRVREVVDYAIDNDMYVILNSHHDAPIIWADINDIDVVAKNVTDLWAQIAVYFKDYDGHLLFESFNEINTKNDSWTYNEGAAVATNILNQLFVNMVRSSGGNNAERVLVCSTFLNGTSDEVLDSFVLPKDSVKDKLIAEVHCYSVYYDQDIEETFQKLRQFSKRINAPVIIGEFGTGDKYNPVDYRDEHAGNFVARANKYGIKCFWWDDGGGYRLFDRQSGAVVYPDIIARLMNPREYVTEITNQVIYNDMSDFSYQTIDAKNGNLLKTNWGALTLNTDNKGIHVTPGHTYRLELECMDEGGGMCMNGIAFYDENLSFLSFIKPSQTNYYTITAPEKAAYMRVTFNNPWGYRSENDFLTFFINNKLFLKISECHK